MNNEKKEPPERVKLPLQLYVILVWDKNDPELCNIPQMVVTGLDGFTEADVATLKASLEK